MFTIRTLPDFDEWLSRLPDMPTRIRLLRRLDRVQGVNLGDVKPVGEGVYEMREQFGPGWRMYYTRRGNEIIVMLAGGDKSSQTADIAKAHRLSKTIQD